MQLQLNKKESQMNEKTSEVRKLANCMRKVATIGLEELLDALEFTETLLSEKTG